MIIHHGAVAGVTGSCHELRTDPDNVVLIDCGLFQGDEASPHGAGADNPAIDFDIRHVRALLVTHCHIDHVGRIPYLMAAGFAGPIYCSEPTAILLPLMLEDALEIGFTRDRDLIERFLDVLKSHIVPLPYHQWVEVPLAGSEARLRIRLQPAGHILGSAYIECDVRRNGDARCIVFSGDLGGPDTPLLPEAEPPERADVLVLESTYGDREHEGRDSRRDTLRRLIEKSLRNGGAILIPAFSIGRTQELLYDIEGIIHQFGGHAVPTASGRSEAWQTMEIIVDSPLASRFTGVYRQLAAFWDREAKQRLAGGRHPLSFEQMTTLDTHAEHESTVQYLHKTAHPCVVIAGAGMCNGGRIVNYLKALIEDARTDILFVGYQAQGTPGHAIQKYGPRHGYVDLDGRRLDIRAGVHTVAGYSAHADQKALLDFVTGIPAPPAEIRLVHGSLPAKAALKERLTTEGYKVG
jgi:metallo-beta-lactamase family protein